MIQQQAEWVEVKPSRTMSLQRAVDFKVELGRKTRAVLLANQTFGYMALQYYSQEVLIEYLCLIYFEHVSHANIIDHLTDPVGEITMMKLNTKLPSS